MRVRVHLKGINWTVKKLADGTRRTYWYAWRGGPLLQGDPGTPAFEASYAAACALRRAPAENVLQSILDAYQHPENVIFRDLAPSTKRSYVAIINKIEADFGDFPLSKLTDRRSRGLFMKWRDKIAVNSGRRSADYAWTVLARILSWAFDRGDVEANSCERGGRLYQGGGRRNKIWTAADEAAFLASAPAHLHLPLIMALWTGQRQGDLLRLPWSAFDGTHIRLRQSKTGEPIRIPAGGPLKAALDAAAKAKRSPIILTTLEGTPWTSDGFRASWRKAQAKAGVLGVTFHDLRGTAVTRLALVGCTEAQIAAVTGHTLSDVRSILDANYLARDPALADAAISKLERAGGFQTASQTGSERSEEEAEKAL
jgi:integrase